MLTIGLGSQHTMEKIEKTVGIANSSFQYSCNRKKKAEALVASEMAAFCVMWFIGLIGWNQ
ncbi:hypothetical protein NECAME_17886, partial [Necator americanus]